ncbi:hypothetical protein SPHS6_00912 [Sphingobium sp. S6]|nr:hypothetical protein SPHS6_00912 [Sphingobium sp. S6]CAD7336301.1 hypothetical protein SPHS8_00951 [Sphingobium sp. S8]
MSLGGMKIVAFEDGWMESVSIIKRGFGLGIE